MLVGDAMASVPDPTGLLSDCGLVLVFQGVEAKAPGNVASSEQGILKPESSNFSLKAVSLNDAYMQMRERRLLPVAPNLQKKYLSSGNFKTNIEGLVRAGEKVIEEYSVVEGLVRTCRKASEEYYLQEPWHITVSLGGSNQLTWALAKEAQPCLPANLRDGKCGAGKSMAGPSPSYQLAQEFSFDPSRVGDIVKKRRKKKMTVAKSVQFQDSKLFKVGQKGKKKKKSKKKEINNNQG